MKLDLPSYSQTQLLLKHLGQLVQPALAAITCSCFDVLRQSADCLEHLGRRTFRSVSMGSRCSQSWRRTMEELWGVRDRLDVRNKVLLFAESFAAARNVAWPILLAPIIDNGCCVLGCRGRSDACGCTWSHDPS